ncbi:MAG TPA: MFS transporter [Pirellulales bacterium]|jgi:MFS family permease
MRVAIRYLVLAWLCLAAALAYGQRFLLGLCATLVQADLALSDQAMGWVMGAFFITYAAFQIPGGWLASRWGSRAALAACVAGCSLSTTMTGAAFGAASLFLLRSVIGIGQAGIFPASTATIARWFPRTERAMASGLLTGFMSAGGAAALACGGWLLKHEYVGWRSAFVLVGVPGIAWAVGFYAWFRNRPEEHKSVRAAELATIQAGSDEPGSRDVVTEPTPWLALATSIPMWLIAMQQFFRAAGYALFASWFPKYLQEMYGSSIEAAGFLTSIAVVAVAIGSPVGGAFSDWLLARTGSRQLSRKGTAIVTMFLCAGLFLAAGLASGAQTAIVLITAANFFGAVAGPVAYAITIDMGGRHVPTVFSIMNMAGNIGAAAFPVVVGILVQWSERWDWIPLFMAGIYVTGAVFWLALDTRGTVFENSEASAVD